MPHPRASRVSYMDPQGLLTTVRVASAWASGSDEYGSGKTLVWDLTDKSKEPVELRGAESNTTDLQFSPDGKWLAASGYDGSVRMWSADDLGASPKVWQVRRCLSR